MMGFHIAPRPQVLAAASNNGSGGVILHVGSRRGHIVPEAI